MLHWYENIFAGIALRIAGVALLLSAWMEGVSLHRMVLAAPSADAPPSQIMLAALMFASASAGMMLACVGGGLWKPVIVLDR